MIQPEMPSNGWKKWDEFFWSTNGEYDEGRVEAVETRPIDKTIERTSRARKTLREQSERLQETELYPRVCILADKDCIENQEINFIEVTDSDQVPKGTIRVHFKLTATHYQKIRSMLEEQKLTLGSIEYKNYHFCYCAQKNIGDIQLKISSVPEVSADYRSAIGIVEIVIPPSALTDENSLGIAVNKILQTELQITDGLMAPTAEAETAYKQARYAWHHKLDSTPAGIEKKLIRTEVAPDYYTFVDPGKHLEYQEITPYVVWHRLEYADNLPKIVKAGGLLSTHERYRRGLLLEGSSSIEDINTGGADSAFARVAIPEEEANVSACFGIMLIFDSDILDRTDWFAYTDDNYGTTRPETFNGRPDPVRFFRDLKQYYSSNNELMFRTGISIDKLRYINCESDAAMIEIYTILVNAGITHIHNQPIEDMIKKVRNLNELVKLSDGKEYAEKSNFVPLLNQLKYRQEWALPNVLAQLRRLANFHTVFEHADEALSSTMLKDECRKFFEYAEQWRQADHPDHPIHSIALFNRISPQDRSALIQACTQVLEVIRLWQELLDEKKDVFISVVPDYFTADDDYFLDYETTRNLERQVSKLLQDITRGHKT